MATDGAMAWADNGESFSISPTEGMKPLSWFFNRIGRNDNYTGEVLSWDEKLEVIYNPKYDPKGYGIGTRDRKRFTHAMGRLRVAPYEEVEVVCDVKASADIFAHRRPQPPDQDKCTASAMVEFNVDLYIGDTRENVKFPIEVTNAASRQTYRRTERITAKGKPGDSLSMYVSVLRDVITMENSRPYKNPREGDPGYSTAATIYNVTVEVDVEMRYENVREQQMFILSKDGFCVYHGRNKFIYCNSYTGEFIVKGASSSE